jgi:hypothetical protein
LAEAAESYKYASNQRNEDGLVRWFCAAQATWVMRGRS